MAERTNTAPHVIIVYHAECLDGMGSAWALTEALPKDTKIHYVPFGHHDTENSKTAIRDIAEKHKNIDTELYFVDVAPKQKFLNELVTSGVFEKIHVYDHHETAAQNLSDYKQTKNTTAVAIHIDPDMPSATKLIWDIFCGTTPAPDVVNIINKMDRGDGLVTDNDFAAAAFLDQKNKDSKNSIANIFSTLTQLKTKTFDDMARAGLPLIQNQDQKIDDLLKTAKYINIQILPDTDPVSIPVIQGNVQTYGRKISHRLVEFAKAARAPVALIWNTQDNGTISLSLRTDGSTDASAIAAFWADKYKTTGGGHKTSAAVHFASSEDFKAFTTP